jgi:hypothetical protein
VVGREESCDETPCTLTLPPGTYRLRLENPIANLGKEVTVLVTSQETALVRETLTRATQPPP